MNSTAKFLLFILPILFFFTNCTPPEKQFTNPPLKKKISAKVLTETPEEIIFDLDQHLLDYKKYRASIPQFKTDLKSQFANSADQLPMAKKLLSTIVIDSIFTYWYGTTWDFNGHTDEPRNGDIACGYFVSTTLKHAGIKLNRYKIAQQAAAVIVDKLCAPTSIQRFTNIDDLSNYVAHTEENDILIIGLDYHVGFVVKRNGKHYFIHSEYQGREGVKKEILESANAIHSSNAYVIGNVTANNALLKQWIASN